MTLRQSNWLVWICVAVCQVYISRWLAEAINRHESFFYTLFLFHSPILKPNFDLDKDIIMNQKNIRVRQIKSHTCVSFNCKALAISILRALVKYLLKWNSFSNSVNCLLVKFVLPVLFPFWDRINSFIIFIAKYQRIDSHHYQWIRYNRYRWWPWRRNWRVVEI